MRPQNMLSASLLAAGLALPLSSVSYANIVISIDKTTQRMAVAVDGTQRYLWPVSTGRPGYDTPNGTFKPNRMEATHFSKEYENAPMPHSIFFDMNGHAIHGFFDVPHLGLAVSHGCVRLSPAHAATLFDLVKSESMGNTTVIVSGRIPTGYGPAIARRPVPAEQTAAEQPMSLAPAYGQQPAPYYGQPAYGQPTNDQYSQPAFPPQPPPYYGRPAYGQPYGEQAHYGQSYSRQPYSGQPYYGQPVYQQPQYGRPFALY